MTIRDLLKTKIYRNNQTFLAKELSLSRNTVKLYMNDIKGEHHFIKENKDGSHSFYANLSNKISSINSLT